MIPTVELINKLKSREIDCIPLSDGYRLEVNKYNQIYISKGGKRKYYLTEKLIKKCLCSASSYKLWNLDVTLIEIKKKLEYMNRRPKEGTYVNSYTKEMLDLIYDVGLDEEDDLDEIKKLWKEDLDKNESCDELDICQDIDLDNT